jgi:hypothetical protein
MSDHRTTGTGAATPTHAEDDVRTGGTRRPTGPRATPDAERIEHERIGIHDESQTIRTDRVRWGPIWAGVVTAVGSYLFLQLLLVAVGLVELRDAAAGDALWSAVAALIAFFIGGVTTGATAMWQGTDDGILHGIIMWFAALVAVILLSALSSGLALGSLDATNAFDNVAVEDVDVGAASDEAQEAAGWALLGFALALAASAAGGALGNKMWPKDDAFIDVLVRRRRDV